MRNMFLFHLNGIGLVFVNYKLILIGSFIFFVPTAALMVHWIRTVAPSVQSLRPQNHRLSTLLQPTSSLIRSLILGCERLFGKQVLFALLGLISGH